MPMRQFDFTSHLNTTHETVLFYVVVSDVSFDGGRVVAVRYSEGKDTVQYDPGNSTPGESDASITRRIVEHAKLRRAHRGPVVVR